MNVNEETMMRERVPLEIQGRVFSSKSTLQNFTIPPALLLGSLLADTIFEPFMMTDSPAQQALSGLFGTGKGAGIGMMFLIVGIAVQRFSVYNGIRKGVVPILSSPENRMFRKESWK